MFDLFLKLNKKKRGIKKSNKRSKINLINFNICFSQLKKKKEKDELNDYCIHRLCYLSSIDFSAFFCFSDFNAQILKEAWQKICGISFIFNYSLRDSYHESKYYDHE